MGYIPLCKPGGTPRVGINVELRRFGKNAADASGPCHVLFSAHIDLTGTPRSLRYYRCRPNPLRYSRLLMIYIIISYFNRPQYIFLLVFFHRVKLPRPPEWSLDEYVMTRRRISTCGLDAPTFSDGPCRLHVL